MLQGDGSKQIRGERLVARVLDATIAELARVGLERLSIDEVASRAEVNKTTIYRRWATPDELAHAAIARVVEVSLDVDDTGSLSSDLAAFVQAARRVFALPHLQWLLRAHFDGTIPRELGDLTREIEDKRYAEVKTLLARATMRGEIPETADVRLLLEVLFAALLSLLLFAHDRGEDHLERVVHTILHGVLEDVEKTGQKSRARLRTRDAKATNLLPYRRTLLR